MKRLLLSGLMAAAMFGAFAADYCTPEGNSTTDGRYTSTLTVTTPAGSQTIEGLQENLGALYYDRTEVKVAANAGDLVTVTPTGKGDWMHNFLYVDYNGNGVFTPDWNADKLEFNAGSELVAFSYLGGYNSEGEQVGEHVSDPYNYPLAFYVPADLADGDYRVRYKVDWDDADPCGGEKDFFKGGIIVDFILQVGEGGEVKPEGAPLTINVTGNGTGVVTVMNRETSDTYPNGSYIPFKAKIVIKAVPDEGCYVASGYADEDGNPYDMTKNFIGNAIDLNWTVDGEYLNIDVEFAKEVNEEGAPLTINITGEGTGTVVVSNYETGEEYTNGSVIPTNAKVEIYAAPDEDCFIAKAFCDESNDPFDMSGYIQGGILDLKYWVAEGDFLKVDIEFGKKEPSEYVETETEFTGNRAVILPAVGEIETFEPYNLKGRAEFYRVEVPDEVLFDHSAGSCSSFTMSAWVKFNDFPTTDDNGSQIMGHRAHLYDNYNGSMLLAYNKDHKFVLNAGAGNGAAGLVTDTEVELNRWYYLTLMYDADNDDTFSIYVDGQLAGSKKNGKAWALFQDTDEVHAECGNMWFVGGHVTDLTLDQLSFYNVALTKDQVVTAMAHPKAVDGIVALYEFNNKVVGSQGMYANEINPLKSLSASFRKLTSSGDRNQWGLAIGTCEEVTPEYEEGRELVEYCTYDGVIDRNDRTTTALNIILGTGQEYEIPVSGKQVYHDLTDYVISTYAGTTVTIDPETAGEWMHGYAYVDFGNDGEFAVVINEDGTIGEGSDLVSYTMYNVGAHFGGADLWVNSLGQENANGNSYAKPGDPLPTFTIPANVEPGEYRMRFKIDWNSLDPCGHPEETANKLGDNGGVIIDVTLRVADAPVRTVMVLPNSSEVGDVEIVSPETDDWMTITTALPVVMKAVPKQGSVLVNWTDMFTNEVLCTEETFTYTGTTDLYVTANFGYIINVVENGGQIIVHDDILNSNYTDGAKVPFSRQLTLDVRAPSGQQLKKLIVNDVDVTEDMKGTEYTMYMPMQNTVIEAEFGEPVYLFNVKYDGTGKGEVYLSASEDGSTVDVKNGEEITIEGDDCYIVVVPEEGSEFTVLIVDDTEYTAEDADDVIDNKYIFYWATGATIEAEVTFNELTGIELIGVDAAGAEFFNLQGVRVDSDNIVPGVYIMRRGNETVKVLVK